MTVKDGKDLFSPELNSRRAMALCVAMMVSADGRYSGDEEQFVAQEVLPALNELGDKRAKLRGVAPQSPLTLSEFRLIYDACVSAIGPRGVPDDQFVSRVLATVTEAEYRQPLFALMLKTAMVDGLDPIREAGILRFSLEAWGLAPGAWPELLVDIGGE